jgi:DNA replication and repair protein RecF
MSGLIVEQLALDSAVDHKNLKILSLSTLSMANFRNHTETRIEISSKPVVITGSNGSGKTTILEAVSLLAPGRGLRKARLGDLGNVRSSQPWAVATLLQGIHGEAKIGTGLDPENEERRLVKIDGKHAGHSELSQHVAMLWLTPQIEQLFQEGASAERKFMDRLVYGFDPSHATRMNAYEQAMRDRNRLLQDNRNDSYWLDALEQTMAEHAASIAASRLEALANINHAMTLATHSFPRSHLAVSGFVEDPLMRGEPALAVEEGFRTALAQNRAADSAAGRALLGVHRSEFHVLHLEKQMPAAQCSTGEQKAVMLSMVLAQTRSMMHLKGLVPILLLDEMIAHLDSTRKLELFEEICQTQAQVWMTGTDAELFADLEGKAQAFRVEEGRIFSL